MKVLFKYVILLLIVGVFSFIIISIIKESGFENKLSSGDKLENAMKLAGNNRNELEKVLSHYRHDSLKYKAACFLIENMIGLHYYGGELIDNYYQFFDIAHKQKKQGKINSFPEYRLITDSLQEVFGHFSRNRLNKLYDIQQLPADYLIDNVDISFKVWRQQPWGKEITFDQFCEYILPYRIEDENPFDYDRLEVYNQYNTLFDSTSNTNKNAIEACITVNNKLIQEGWLWTDGVGMLPHFGAKTILENRVGVCREYADIAVYTMRAVGIPVTIDFTPQWPFRSMGHTWNVVLTQEGKSIPFMGVESNPGVPHKSDHKMAKAYRKSYAIQPQSLAVIAGKNGIIPGFFKDPRFYDVSDKYFDAVNVIVSAKNYRKKNPFAYICVFDNKDWVPVHWGRIKNGFVKFTQMGRDIVYLKALYKQNGLYFFDYPFLLTKNGEVEYLKPDFNKRQTMRLTRKYPVLTIRWRLERMIGGKFQGANQSDFKDSVTLCTIDTLPDIFYQTKTITVDKPFRYLRYLSPKNSHGNIAELEFYGEDDDINPLKGKIIGDDPIAPGRGKEKAMDGDISTFFDAYKAHNAWVGLDLGNRHNIKKIRFIPVNDGNNIAPGDHYELFYFRADNGWTSCGSKIADSFELVFDDVPSGALYLLHNYTRGVEERIFTYEDGEQIWW